MRKSLIFLLAMVVCAASVFAGNPTNETLTTKVLIGNTGPFVQTADIYDGDNVSIEDNFDLVEATTKSLNCSGKFYDVDADAISITATLYDSAVAASGDSDDHRNHYSNADCTESQDGGSQNGTYECLFDVYYHANPSASWKCNVTASDGSETHSLESVTHTVNELVAADIEDGDIDWGEMQLDAYAPDDSSSQNNSVYNWGNVELDFLFVAYATALSDGLTMDCAGGNITTDKIKVKPASDLTDYAGDGGAVPNDAGTEASQEVNLAVSTVASGVPTTLEANATIFYGLHVPATATDGVTALSGQCTGNLNIEPKKSD